MDKAPDEAKEVYNHHGVIIRRLDRYGEREAAGSSANFISFISSGTMHILEHNNDRWILWVPEEKSLRVESDPTEWEVVNTEKPKHNPGNDEKLEAKKIWINLNDLKSLQLRRNSNKMFFDLKDNTTFDVDFQNGDAYNFISSFKSYAILEKSRRSRQKYYVKGSVNRELSKSFAELDLFGEQGNLVARFMKDLHDRPFETTLTAFSKLTGAVASGLTGSARPEGASNINHGLSHGDEYEVIATTSQQPSLGMSPRPEVMRGPPLSVEEWMRHANDDGTISRIESLLQTIFRGGIDHALRYDVWKYLLNYLPFRLNHTEAAELRRMKIKEYQTLCQQWQSFTPGQEERFSLFRDRKSLISKDVNRTDRTFEYFAGDRNPHLDSLNNILMSYMMYNFDLGYVQGMSDLLSPILMLMDNEPDAFWCFVGFMDRTMGNFMMEQTSMKEQLLQLACLLQILDPELANYLNAHESGNLFFCFRWLLVLFKREFSNEDIMIIWEVFWTGLPCPNFHLLFCIAILETEREQIMANDNGLSDILAHVNSLSMNIDRDAMLCKAEAMYLQLQANAEKLPKMACLTLGLAVSVDASAAEQEERFKDTHVTPSDDEDDAFEKAISYSFL
ncbi:Hypothetical predicted protein [Cloeon dipterum]|uniref:TBC1 domain family member 15 n=1 Tax=Cloeon dipterum TaxID=197152 RepID=A0A8S1BKW1_9INSE|nr:Hypothetical predicted protein [Cloeon dipterum]